MVEKILESKAKDPQSEISVLESSAKDSGTNTFAPECQIDSLVYELYGLSEE